LHTGEGDRLDVDAMMAHARTARRDRRRNRTAIGGAVVAVLAVAGVITGVQLNRDDHAKAGAGPNPTGSASPTGPSNSTGSGGPAGPACPATAPIVPQSFAAATGPLFPDDLISIKVCVYDVQRLTNSKNIDGPAARSYGQRFNALPLKGKQICPQFLTQITVAMLPVTSQGVAPTVVGKVSGCGTTSNGTGARDAGQLLAEIQVGTGHSPIPTVPGHTMSPGPGPS
jgi:hypothetical protein